MEDDTNKRMCTVKIQVSAGTTHTKTGNNVEDMSYGMNNEFPGQVKLKAQSLCLLQDLGDTMGKNHSRGTHANGHFRQQQAVIWQKELHGTTKQCGQLKPSSWRHCIKAQLITPSQWELSFSKSLRDHAKNLYNYAVVQEKINNHI